MRSVTAILLIACLGMAQASLLKSLQVRAVAHMQPVQISFDLIFNILDQVHQLTRTKGAISGGMFHLNSPGVALTDIGNIFAQTGGSGLYNMSLVLDAFNDPKKALNQVLILGRGHYRVEQATTDLFIATDTSTKKLLVISKSKYAGIFVLYNSQEQINRKEAIDALIKLRDHLKENESN